MEFENQYLSYEEYIELEGTLEEMPFKKLEFECRRIIDERTQNRLKNVSTIPQEVKICEYKMIEYISNYQSGLEQVNKGISSENIDGYIVNYSNDYESIIKSKKNELQEFMSIYLFGVIVNDEHLLYIGV